MRYPLNDWIQTQGFGADPGTYSQFGMKGHNGLDSAAPIGTPIFAPEDGIIFISANGTKDQYTGNIVAGETIVIKGSYEHWLLHNSERLVSAGKKVAQGQLVAHSGNTGFTTGPHCHWGVRPLSPDLNNGYRGFIDQTNLIEEEVMFNEGDRVNWNNAVYGQDLGYHKDLVDKVSFKEALEKIRVSPEFIGTTRTSRGDIYNELKFFAGHDPSDSDYAHYVGNLTHKQTIYDLMSRQDVKTHQATNINRDSALDYINKNLK